MADRTADPSIIRLGGGFTEYDRHIIESALAQLLARVATSDRLWELEISVKEREKPGQRVTLEAWVPGKERLVATSSLANLKDALNDVGADVLRQYNRAAELASRDHRNKRETIRGQEPQDLSAD
ncbi:MAG: HPF/RaiA family ribosome-associated protein [Actinomycetales bacterium]|nr:HPF/RaiA family ribosome-associated protein [Tetrasphaera sp.]NLW99740.1 HPF/RaiA family ribosome-associated protein [Actinomycetales bacterium]